MHAHFFQDFGVTRKFGQRQERGALDGAGGSLGGGIVGANGFDGVAEEFEADRLQRFGRIDVDDAAADGELAGHVAGDLFVVAGAGEKIDQGLMLDGFVAGDGAGELRIKFAVAQAPERGLDRSDEEVGFAGGEAPERDGAVFGNFGVRGTIFVGQNFVSRKVDDAAVGFSGNGAIKIAQRLEEHFGALIGFDQDDEGTAEFGESQRDDEGFGRIGEAGEAHFAASAAQRVEGLLGDRAAGHSREKLADDGKNHAGSCLMRSRRRAVEKPGSSGMRIDLGAGSTGGFVVEKFVLVGSELAAFGDDFGREACDKFARGGLVVLGDVIDGRRDSPEFRRARFPDSRKARAGWS